MKVSTNLLTRTALAAAMAVLIPAGVVHAQPNQQKAPTTSQEAATSEGEIRQFYERYIAALNAHEFHRMPEFIADSVTLNGNPGTRADVMAVLTADAEAVPDLRWRLDGLIIDGNRIGARLTNFGKPAKAWLGVAPSGKSFEVTEYAVYTVRDGRFIHMAAIHDAEALSKQVGK
ncbi:MAG: ester cyclase [Phenylobacterium sp.]